MKRSIAIILVSLFCFTGCAGWGKWSPTVQTWMGNVDWVTLVDGTIKSVSFLQKTAKVGIGLPCKLGILDADICALYKLADDAAVPAIASAKSAMAAYKANPSAGNEALMKAAYDALVRAWDTYNLANSQAETVVAATSPLPVVPVDTPAGS